MAQVKFYKGAFANYPVSPDTNGLYYLSLTDANGVKVYGQVKDGAGRLYTSNVFDAAITTADDASSKVLTISTVDNGIVSDASLSFYPITKEEYDAINSSIANVEADSAVVIEKDETSTDYAAVYNFYQGTSDTSLIGTVNIPKDLVVKSGDVSLHSDGSTYIDLTLSNDDSTVISINVNDLIDEGYVDEKIQALDYEDTAVDNQYVSAVSEVDGVISVTRADLPVVSVSGDSSSFISAETTDGAVTVSATVISTSTGIEDSSTTDGLVSASAVKYYIDTFIANSLEWNEL